MDNNLTKIKTQNKTSKFIINCFVVVAVLAFLIIAFGVVLALLISFAIISVCSGVLSLITSHKYKSQNKIYRMGNEKCSVLIEKFNDMLSAKYKYQRKNNVKNYIDLKMAQCEFNNEVDIFDKNKTTLTQKENKGLEKYKKFNPAYFEKVNLVYKESAEREINGIQFLQCKVNQFKDSTEPEKIAVIKKLEDDIYNKLNNSQIPNYYPMCQTNGKDLAVLEKAKISKIKRFGHNELEALEELGMIN